MQHCYSCDRQPRLGATLVISVPRRASRHERVACVQKFLNGMQHGRHVQVRCAFRLLQTSTDAIMTRTRNPVTGHDGVVRLSFCIRPTTLVFEPLKLILVAHHIFAPAGRSGLSCWSVHSHPEFEARYLYLLAFGVDLIALILTSSSTASINREPKK